MTWRSGPPMDRRRWARVRRRVFERDGWRCRTCGRAGRLECDHVRPMHRGGSRWELDNLRTLCRRCHFEKTARERTPEPSPESEAWRELVEALAKP